MNTRSIGHGVYEQVEGGKVIAYWARPWIQKRRTWRKLDAVKRTAAIVEAETTDWEGKGGKFVDLAKAYIEAGCPNRRLEPRHDGFTGPESKRAETLKEFFGRYNPDEIRIPLLPKYKEWRIARLKAKTASGERTVDMDLNTLSNILSYGVAIGRIDFNYVRSGRPRYRKKSDVVGSRFKAPKDADQLHTIARRLFQQPLSEVLGWQTLFSALTGCRRSEILRLRKDAKSESEPGYVDSTHLYIRRSKRGVNPFVNLTPELRDLLKHHDAWLKERYPKSPWYFPSPWDSGQAIGPQSLAHALNRVCKELKMHHVTAHGLRSFYSTKRRSDGVLDAQIAAEIGDKTVEIVSETYADLPANWMGGKSLSFLPSKGKPAWKHVFTGLNRGLKKKTTKKTSISPA